MGFHFKLKSCLCFFAISKSKHQLKFGLCVKKSHTMMFCLLFKRINLFCCSVTTQTQRLTRDLLLSWFPGDVQASEARSADSFQQCRWRQFPKFWHEDIHTLVVVHPAVDEQYLIALVAAVKALPVPAPVSPGRT